LTVLKLSVWINCFQISEEHAKCMFHFGEELNWSKFNNTTLFIIIYSILWIITHLHVLFSEHVSTFTMSSSGLSALCYKLDVCSMILLFMVVCALEHCRCLKLLSRTVFQVSTFYFKNMVVHIFNLLHLKSISYLILHSI
jgi:hypothetical protein